MCVEGSVDIISEETTYTVNNGETLLVPAALNTIALKAGNAKVLEVYF